VLGAQFFLPRAQGTLDRPLCKRNFQFEVNKVDKYNIGTKIELKFQIEEDVRKGRRNIDCSFPKLSHTSNIFQHLYFTTNKCRKKIDG